MQRRDLRTLWVCCLVLLSLFWSGEAQAGQLSDRLAQFPHWDNKPPVQAVTAVEDLIYPDWMAGTWNVTSTLVDLAAPLAPEIVTPGFESNRKSLNLPITFPVRFKAISQNNLPVSTLNPKSFGVAVRSAIGRPKFLGSVVADRGFNGLSIAKATLGDRAILSVKVDPHNPNRQITMLRGEQQLVSVITGRTSEIPNPDQFIATELTQQILRKAPQLYLNEVETTTAYRLRQTASASTIEADQITAVYLSPQDPNYFAARNQPVSLYRYRLEFFPVASKD